MPRPGIPRRIDPRGAAQRVHLQARVVGEAGQAGALEKIARFLQGVLLQGTPRLGDVFGDAQRSGRNDFKIRSEDLGSLAELAGVAGGENDLHNRGKGTILMLIFVQLC